MVIESAIIAGAGIVGLTTAVRLSQMGVHVLVCEQAPEIRAAGASIGLWRNALDVLDDAGLGAAIDALGTPIATWFYDTTGTPHRDPAYADADHEFLLVPRRQLNELLADTVGRGSIRLGARLIGFEETADSVTAEFADGTRATADLLIGADGVYSRVREHLFPGTDAYEHTGHHAWRATVPAGSGPAAGTILTVGDHRSRGGFTRTYGDTIMWMVNRFDCPPLTGTKREQALEVAGFLNDNGWNDALLDLIDATPEDAILHNQIMFVPTLPRWTSDRVALIGDAAHGLSPHIAAGGTLGIEDVGVLTHALTGHAALPEALRAYESDRLPRYRTVHEHSREVEQAGDAGVYAHRYAAFSHWMLTERPKVGI
ncbi:FAD-dependent oxidoreductase [Nocardia sp. NPDC020380]|uniref:FAD-dependent oxidoreductase n=1 Tax=Nocardia sp. NPDC020380 TaxID=3364309 RepID=UPI0037B48DB8